MAQQEIHHNSISGPFNFGANSTATQTNLTNTPSITPNPSTTPNQSNNANLQKLKVEVVNQLQAMQIPLSSEILNFITYAKNENDLKQIINNYVSELLPNNNSQSEEQYEREEQYEQKEGQIHGENDKSGLPSPLSMDKNDNNNNNCLGYLGNDIHNGKFDHIIKKENKEYDGKYGIPKNKYNSNQQWNNNNNNNIKKESDK
eukprot:60245_1